jgi:hypothetical protein
MSVACVLTALAVSTMLALGAELHGAWSASSSNGRSLGGTWTAEAHQESGGVTGTWTLRETTGKILASGVWSASKAPKAWDGAWRSIAAVGGTWKAGGYSGSWSIRAAP